MNDLPTIMNEDDGKRTMGRQEAAQVILFAAVDQELLQNPPGGVWELDRSAYNVIQALKQEKAEDWPSIDAHIVLKAISSIIQRRLLREIKSEARADARQGVLALPGFELVSPWVKIEGGIAPLNKVTIEQHQHSVKDRALKIKNMAYPRWSAERMKAEKAALVQERKLDRNVILATAGDKEATMGPAMELAQAILEKPARKQRRKAAKLATDGRWPRT